MFSTDDILEQLSHARADHTVGPDAMRWSPEPPPAPVPTVPFTGRAAARAAVVRHLVDDHDLTPDTAAAAVRAAEDGQPTEHLELVSDAAQAAAAEASQHISQAINAFLRTLQPLIEAAAAALNQVSEAARAAGYHPRSKPGRRTDQPAWQSPYGPARKRRH